MSCVKTDVLPGLSTNKSWHSCRTFCNSVICSDSSCTFGTSSLISCSLAFPLVTDTSPGSSTGISWGNVCHHAFNCFPFPVRLEQIAVINLRYLPLSKQAYNVVHVSFWTLQDLPTAPRACFSPKVIESLLYCWLQIDASWLSGRNTRCTYAGL